MLLPNIQLDKFEFYQTLNVYGQSKIPGNIPHSIRSHALIRQKINMDFLETLSDDRKDLLYDLCRNTSSQRLLTCFIRGVLLSELCRLSSEEATLILKYPNAALLLGQIFSQSYLTPAHTVLLYRLNQPILTTLFLDSSEKKQRVLLNNFTLHQSPLIEDLFSNNFFVNLVRTDKTTFEQLASYSPAQLKRLSSHHAGLLIKHLPIEEILKISNERWPLLAKNATIRRRLQHGELSINKLNAFTASELSQSEHSFHPLLSAKVFEKLKESTFDPNAVSDHLYSSALAVYFESNPNLTFEQFRRLDQCKLLQVTRVRSF